MNTPSRSTALLSQLGIGAPIIQAPMAGVATPALAAAVSNAGGLGSLGLGAMNADAARKAIRDTRAQTDAPFNVNVFCHAPAIANETIEAQWLDWLAPEFARLGATPPEKLGEIYTSFLADDAMLDMLLDEKPPVVSFHFGLPGREAIAALKRAGITLLASATNLDEAKSIADAQLDAVIAQGIEAGGHRGMFDPAAFDDGLGTFALTRLLVRHIDLPVISAGGIMDGAGIVAALALGAQAAQMGTAFVACPETSSDAGYRAAMTGEPARHTVLTPAISGRPARSMVNRMTDLVHCANAPRLPAYPIAYDAAKALMNAAKAAGESNYGGQWAGQGAPLARAMPAAELVSQLKREMAVAVRALQAIAV